MTRAPDPAVARLLALRSATAALLAGIEDEAWSDTAVQQPSLLPDWTRGHVLTHLARNADAIARTLSAGLVGEQAPLYPDGQDGRKADIEAGAGRPVLEQLTDLRDACDRLDRVLAAVADADGWDLPCGDDRPAREYLDARWREVEIHRVDLDGAYAAADWPVDFVAVALPYVLADAAPRLGQAVRIRTDSGVTWDGGDGADGGDGEPAEVTGPDWAVLAWLLRRPTGGAVPGLSDAPPIERGR